LRPEAERLVEQLWREKNDPANVVVALRADRVLSETLRHAAFRAVLRKVQPPADAQASRMIRPDTSVTNSRPLFSW
jgi:hypothetical protein